MMTGGLQRILDGFVVTEISQHALLIGEVAFGLFVVYLVLGILCRYLKTDGDATTLLPQVLAPDRLIVLPPGRPVRKAIKQKTLRPQP